MSREGDEGAMHSEGFAQNLLASSQGWAGFPVSARLDIVKNDVLGANVLWSEHGDVEGVAGIWGGVVEPVNNALSRYTSLGQNLVEIFELVGFRDRVGCSQAGRSLSNTQVVVVFGKLAAKIYLEHHKYAMLLHH